MDEEWSAVLRKYDLPFFHMACCAHGTGVFADRSRSQRVEIETAMIGIIKRRIERGIAVTVSESDYTRIVPTGVLDVVGHTYTLCIRLCLQGVAEWIGTDANTWVSYFFEAGHEHQAVANETLTRVFGSPVLRRQYRYASHTFAPKVAVPGGPCIRLLQAADLLAWQVRKWRADGCKSSPRLDFTSLVEAPHFIRHLDELELKELSETAVSFKSHWNGGDDILKA